MDNLMIFSALDIVRIGFRDVPSFLDEDLRALYAQRLAELPPAQPMRVRIANRFATLLERLAARLRHPVDEPAGRVWHA